MTSLTERVEHAVLAALLADPAPPAHLYGLHTEDFTDPTHRKVFAAFDTVAFSQTQTTPEHRDRSIAAQVDDPTVDTRTLAAWRLMAPGADRTAHYAEYVRAGSIYRDLAAAADRAATQTTPHDPAQAQHHQLLAHTLRLHAGAYTAVTSDGPDPATGKDIEQTPSARAVLEDQVLAGLIDDPDQITVVAAFLTDNAFSSTQRRHVYRTLVTMDHDGDPIDDLSIAWRVELETAHALIYGVDVLAPGSTLDEEVYPVVEDDHESPTTYLERLTTTALVAETVIHAARDLLTEHLHHALPDPTTVDIEQATRPDTMHTTPAHTTEITTTPAAPAAQTTHVDTQTVVFTTAQAPGPLPASGLPQPGRPETDPTITQGVRP